MKAEDYDYAEDAITNMEHRLNNYLNYIEDEQ